MSVGLESDGALGVFAQALASSQAYIFEERDRLLQLQEENNELRLQEVEDRHRLQHLLFLLDAQKTRKEGKECSAAAKVVAPDAEVLQLRVESLRSKLAEQVRIKV